jgi:hypothetical protein
LYGFAASLGGVNRATPIRNGFLELADLNASDGPTAIDAVKRRQSPAVRASVSARFNS